MEHHIFKYPQTRHLVGSGIPSESDRIDWHDIVGRNVVLEEKIDGSHSGFWFDAGGDAHALSRGTELDLNSKSGIEKPFDLFKDWLTAKEAVLLDRIEDRYAVFGEWAYAAHTVFYDALPHFFLEFDVLDRQSGEYLSTPKRRELLAGLPIVSVPVLFEGAASVERHPSGLVNTSLFKTDGWRAAWLRVVAQAGLDQERMSDVIEVSDQSEGIYGKVEENGRVVLRFKWVRPEFVRKIVDGNSHWRTRPTVANRLADGVDIFSR